MMTWHKDTTCTVCGSKTLWCEDSASPIYYLRDDSETPCPDGCKTADMTVHAYTQT